MVTRGSGGGAQETRKIRKQRREEKEKEKQDLIRQGLLEPPPPKVWGLPLSTGLPLLSNMSAAVHDHAAPVAQ